ncbi:MAG: hypothetical protein AAF490_15745 [Chloroflexota bacterium]
MNIRKFRKIVVGFIVLTGLVLGGYATTLAGVEQGKGLQTHPSRGDVQEVERSMARLMTSSKGARLQINTSELEPNHAYTIWFVAVNDPSSCAADPCTSKEILLDTDFVNAEVAYAAGAVADERGQASFSAFLRLGDLPKQWFGNGFTNPDGEIHAVIMSHGPVIEGMEEDMITTLRGGCTDESVPAPFPPNAHADGQPGPNSCQLYQFVIFDRGE